MLCRRFGLAQFAGGSLGLIRCGISVILTAPQHYRRPARQHDGLQCDTRPRRSPSACLGSHAGTVFARYEFVLAASWHTIRSLHLARPIGSMVRL